MTFSKRWKKNGMVKIINKYSIMTKIIKLVDFQSKLDMPKNNKMKEKEKFLKTFSVVQLEIILKWRSTKTWTKMWAKEILILFYKVNNLKVLMMTCITVKWEMMYSSIIHFWILKMNICKIWTWIHQSLVLKYNIRTQGMPKRIRRKIMSQNSQILVLLCQGPIQ